MSVQHWRATDTGGDRAQPARHGPMGGVATRRSSCVERTRTTTWTTTTETTTTTTMTSTCSRHLSMYHASLLAVCLWTKHAAAKEYCYLQDFTASCSAGSVVLITAAEYGRMEIGECMTLMEHSCSVDVLEDLNARCSGRQNCSLPVTSFDRLAHGCPSDVKPYLDATYTCVEVSGPVTCLAAAVAGLLYSAPLTASSGHLMAGSVAGSARCPWHVRLAGRTLRLTVIDVGLPPGPACPLVLVVSEDEADPGTTVELCGGEGERRRTVFTSRADTLAAYLAVNASFAARPYLILHYEVTGCRNILAPAHTSLTRLGDTLNITCLFTGDVWSQHCVEQHWRGDVGNCTAIVNVETTAGLPLSSAAAPLTSEEGAPDTIVIAAPVATAVVLVLILALAIFFVRRHNRRSKARRSSYANQLSAIEVPYRPDALAAGVKTIPLESPVTLLDAPALYGLRRSASGEPMTTSASTLATVHASREMVPPDPGGDYQSLARIAYVRRSRLSSEHIYDTVSGDGLSIGRLSVDNY